MLRAWKPAVIWYKAAMASDAKSRELEGLQRQLCLDELTSAHTPLLRRAELLASLRERFDALVASQISQLHATVIVPALCEAGVLPPVEGRGGWTGTPKL